LAISSLATILSGMLFTGGCVSKQEYDDVLAANRRAQLQLEQLQDAYRKLQMENQALGNSLKDLQAANQKLAGDADLQRNQNKDLQAAFDALNQRYQALIAGTKPIELPEGPLLPPTLDKALRDFAAAHPELLTYLPKYGMIKLNADLTFEKGSDDLSTLSAQAKEALKKFVEIINSDAAAKFNVYIAGHTDDIPIAKPETKRRHPTNWYLSVHRAVSVLKELGRDGLTDSRMGAMGFGEYHPVAPNAPGNKGNVANRRVEIWIVSPERFLTVTGDMSETSK
jgi:chemotaxis protein MotB